MGAKKKDDRFAHSCVCASVLFVMLRFVVFAVANAIRRNQECVSNELMFSLVNGAFDG